MRVPPDPTCVVYFEVCLDIFASSGRREYIGTGQFIDPFEKNGFVIYEEHL